MTVQDGSSRDIDDAVKLDPPALGLGLAVADAEPADEPVAGVTGAVPGHRTGHHGVADDPRVDLTQGWLGDHAVGAPDGALGGYPGQPYLHGEAPVHPEVVHHLSVGARHCFHENADDDHGLWRVGGHAASPGLAW